MKIRWLDLEKPMKYVGRANNKYRGRRCRPMVVSGKRIKNIAVEFGDGHRMVVPFGCLRNEKE